MKILIVVACLLAAAAAQEDKITEAEEKVCAREYLDGRNLTARCDFVIKHMQKEMYDFIIGGETFDFTLNCIKDYIKKYDFFNYFLHAELEIKSEQPSIEVQLEQITIKQAPQSLCGRSYGFDGLFDQFLVEWKSRRGDKKYQCMYKYSIEKKIIEKSDFDFDTSAFDSFNCTGYFKEFDEQFKITEFAQGKSPSKFKACADRKLAGYQMFRDLEVIMAIGTFDLSEVQLSKIKAFYWEWFTGGDRMIMECVRDVYKKPE